MFQQHDESQNTKMMPEVQRRPTNFAPWKPSSANVILPSRFYLDGKQGLHLRGSKDY
jgi:hypothetical protein